MLATHFADHVRVYFTPSQFTFLSQWKIDLLERLAFKSYEDSEGWSFFLRTNDWKIYFNATSRFPRFTSAPCNN